MELLDGPMGLQDFGCVRQDTGDKDRSYRVSQRRPAPENSSCMKATPPRGCLSCMHRSRVQIPPALAPLPQFSPAVHSEPHTFTNTTSQWVPRPPPAAPPPWPRHKTLLTGTPPAPSTPRSRSWSRGTSGGTRLTHWSQWQRHRCQSTCANTLHQVRAPGRRSSTQLLSGPAAAAGMLCRGCYGRCTCSLCLQQPPLARARLEQCVTLARMTQLADGPCRLAWQYADHPSASDVLLPAPPPSSSPSPPPPKSPFNQMTVTM